MSPPLVMRRECGTFPFYRINFENPNETEHPVEICSLTASASRAQSAFIKGRGKNAFLPIFSRGGGGGGSDGMPLAADNDSRRMFPEMPKALLSFRKISTLDAYDVFRSPVTEYFCCQYNKKCDDHS